MHIFLLVNLKAFQSLICIFVIYSNRHFLKCSRPLEKLWLWLWPQFCIHIYELSLFAWIEIKLIRYSWQLETIRLSGKVCCVHSLTVLVSFAKAYKT